MKNVMGQSPIKQINGILDYMVHMPPEPVKGSFTMWISVKKKMPGDEQSDKEIAVLLSGKFKRVAYFYRDSYGPHWSCPYNPWEHAWDRHVTHWMLLPDPPYKNRGK